MKNLSLAALAILFLTVAAIGCYLFGTVYGSSVGIALLSGGLAGMLALCLNGVAAGSTIQYND